MKFRFHVLLAFGLLLSVSSSTNPFAYAESNGFFGDRDVRSGGVTSSGIISTRTSSTTANSSDDVQIVNSPPDVQPKPTNFQEFSNQTNQELRKALNEKDHYETLKNIKINQNDFDISGSQGAFAAPMKKGPVDAAAMGISPEMLEQTQQMVNRFQKMSQTGPNGQKAPWAKSLESLQETFKETMGGPPGDPKRGSKEKDNRF